MLQKFTVIEGNIGSGKTTLCKKISKEYGANLILEEFEENPFLSDFLENQKNNPLGVELQFLIDRFHQLRSSFDNSKPTVADYFIEKSLIFSSNNLSKIEKNLFDSYYDVLFEKVAEPDLLVYLSVSSDRLIENIKKRGRKIEEKLTRTYLESIHTSYLNYFKKNERKNVLVIDVSELDFVENKNDYKKIKATILNHDRKGYYEIKL
jgi:deoxyguanosine kinase